MDGLDYAKCQKSRKRTHWELLEFLIELDKNVNNVIFSKLKDQKSCSREKECNGCVFHF